MAQHYEAIVLGLGGMGSAALAQLALRGRRVLGIEQFQPAHNLGSSHGESRITRQAYFEDPAYVPLLFRAAELWTDLEKRSGRQLFVPSGAVVVGREGTEVNRSIESARQYGIPHEVLTPSDIRRRWDVMRPRADEIALFEPTAGILLPEDCILAHLQVAAGAGAETRFGTQVLGWAATDGGVRVSTSAGEFSAERLVITAGAWFGKVVPELGLPLQIERNIMHYFEPASRAPAFAPERCPIYIVKRPDSGSFYGFPALPGRGVKMALHHSRQYVDPDGIDRGVYPDEVERARQALAEWLPDAAGQCLGSAVCMFTMTPDTHFVVGLHPTSPQVVLAGGFSGHGYKFCSVMGEVLADLTTTGATNHPIGFLSPTRFAAAQKA